MRASPEPCAPAALAHPVPAFPHSRTPTATGSFRLRGTAAASYRLDLLAQAWTGAPWPAAARHWQARLEAQVAHLPLDRVDPVPVLDEDATPAAFSSAAKARRPVVLRGLLQRFVSLSRWRLSRLRAELSALPVSLACPASPAYRGQLRELAVPGVYLQDDQELLRHRPELAHALGMDELCALFGAPAPELAELRLALGRRSSPTGWRCGAGGELTVVLDGQVKLSLVDPAWSPLLRPRLGPAGTWRGGAEPGAAAPRPPETEAADRRLQRHCPRLEVELGPGDVLLRPSWWWQTAQAARSGSVVASCPLPLRRGDASANPSLAWAGRLARVPPQPPAAPEQEARIRGHYARKGALHLRMPRLREPRASSPC